MVCGQGRDGRVSLFGLDWCENPSPDACDDQARSKQRAADSFHAGFSGPRSVAAQKAGLIAGVAPLLECRRRFPAKLAQDCQGAA